MTSPLRRKRPITPPSIRRPRSTSRLAAAACALAVAAAATPLAAALQWRSASAGAAGAPLRRDADLAPAAHALPAAEGPDHSVLVDRDAPRVAQAPPPFDPFEADLDDAPPMPAAEPAPTPFDPFDADQDNADEANADQPLDHAADESTAADLTAMQDAFDEPAADEPSAGAEELDAAREAIDEEIMRRDVESGAAQELVPPQSPPTEETAPAEPPAEEAPQLEDEVVPPADDPQQMEQDLLDQFGPQPGDDLDLQVGPEAQLQLTPEQQQQRQRQLEEERLEHQAECEQLFNAVRGDSIKNISLDIRVQGSAGEDFPFECTTTPRSFQARAWPEITYLWKASGLCHKPLYFEQVQLERYGHDAGPVLQPIISGAHFFGTLPILPYKMGLQTPQECVYALGYYRPGNCAPYMVQPLGFTWRAAAFQAGAVTGTAVAIP
ncbi:MAG: hypothetical protein IT424_00735 [Pirellulales bacterium]|nr:hypothetical protein [Pirellulales bacterium]